MNKTSDKYDLIFIDAPYDKGLINPTLEGIYENELAEGGIIVVEHEVREKIQEQCEQRIIKSKVGKVTGVTLLS